MTPIKSVKILIWGKVQGVFFRKSAKDEADKLGLGGWVRNNKDGSVEIMATGDKDSLNELVKWCGSGSTLAQVERVDVERQKDVQDFESFEILN